MNILNHKKLMTPFLIEKFGKIYVETITEQEDEFTYSRTSIIRQLSTNKKILDASIEVQITTLPDQLIKQLKSTQIAFGQLLQNYHIDVTIENLQLFKTVDEREGRKVDIVHTASNALICHVEEILIR